MYDLDEMMLQPLQIEETFKKKMASELTVSNQLAGTNSLYDVHTDEGDQHQGNGQLAEMVEPHSHVHLHLQPTTRRGGQCFASIASQTEH